MPALAARPEFATSWRSPISSTAAESVQLYSARMAGDPKSYRYRRRGDRNYSSVDHLSHGLILGNGEVNIVKKLDSDSRPADDRGVVIQCRSARRVESRRSVSSPALELRGARITTN
jgi:hypothetical protein